MKMKYIIGAILFLIITACSSPEPLIDEQDQPETESSLPAWYNPGTISSLDEQYFRGYSMSAASDSAVAIQSGKETTIANVRYEIDRFVEEVRVELISDSSDVIYSAPNFIIKLRNAVQELQLNGYKVDRVLEVIKGDITQVYTKISVDRRLAIERISELIADESFSTALKGYIDEP